MKTKLLKTSLLTLMITGFTSIAQVSDFDALAFSFDNAGSANGAGPAEDWTQIAGFETSDEQAKTGTFSMKLPIDGQVNSDAKLQTWRNSGDSDGKFDMLAGNYSLSYQVRVTGVFPSSLNFTYTNTSDKSSELTQETVAVNESLVGLTPDIWNEKVLLFTASIPGNDCWFSVKCAGFPADASPDDATDDGALYVDDILVTFLSVLDVEKTNVLEGVSIYPNPVNRSESLKIECPIESTVKIANISGVILDVITTSSSKTEINISDLSSGIYIIKVISEGKSYVTKVVVQ